MHHGPQPQAGPTAYAPDRAAPAARVSVDELFGRVFPYVRAAARAAGLEARCEVIAWEPLDLAADVAPLCDVLRNLTDYVVRSSVRGAVYLRAFACDDSAYATVEILGGEPAPVDRADLEHVLVEARRRVHAMGGDLLTLGADSGAHVALHLPQWTAGEPGEPLFLSTPQ